MKKVKMETKEDKVKRIGDEILKHARFVIGIAAGNDTQMRFKLNRWVYARLQQEEIREKRPIKQALWDSGIRACQKCTRKFKSIKGVEIHRKDSNKIYSVENCQLLCRECHQK
jgi:5-methylcytosine-specific restriction endonuclease McrA